MFYALAAGNAAMILSFILRFRTLPPQVPLFYSNPSGEAQIADLWMIILLPVIMNFFFFFNIFLHRRFFAGNVIMQKLLMFINIFFCITLTLIFMKIIFLVS